MPNEQNWYAKIYSSGDQPGSELGCGVGKQEPRQRHLRNVLRVKSRSAPVRGMISQEYDT